MHNHDQQRHTFAAYRRPPRHPAPGAASSLKTKTREAKRSTLHSIEAKVETALVVMTEDERRQRARELIQEAFAERPLKLIEGEVIEADAAETLATEREVMGESMGSAAIPEASSLESQDE